MRKRIFAGILALSLCLTPLTASAVAILVEPETTDLEYYTTSYTALKEADSIMYSGNQVLIHMELPVMTDGCVVTPNTMEWEVSGTADVTYESDSFFKSVSYEENYANTYCLITANSPGTVYVKGTEYSLYDSDGTDFYFNFTVDADGNFLEEVSMVEPQIPYVIDEDAVHFYRVELNAVFDLIVSSNQEYTVTHATNECTFTPEEDGRYVVSTREYCEEIVDYGESGHFHYFYPVLKNYTVDVEDGEISVTEQGSKNWYSEEQVLEAIAEAEGVEDIACYDVYAAQPDGVMHGLYFSFVNGQLPAVQGDYDSYITNVYTEYGTDSYFCVNYCSADIQQDINGNEPQRVMAEELDISALLTEFWTSSTCNGDLTTPGHDVMEFSRIAAPEEDGDLTVLVDNLDAVYSYPLTVEDGIFRYRKTSEIMGDCNNDGSFSVADVVMLQKYLLGAGTLTVPEQAELCADGIINGFDLAIMKHELVTQAAAPLLLVREARTVENENGWDSESYIKVLDADGFWHVRQSETDAWELTAEDCLAKAPTIIAGTEPSGQFAAAQLGAVQDFVQNAASYQGTELTAWSLVVADYGQEDLFAVYPDGNGSYQAVELCRFGGECAWIEDAEVQELVEMLVQNGYYGDESIFEVYLENQ